MPNSFPEPVRLGVVGAGRIAQVAHLPAIMHASSVDLIGVYDPSAFLRDGVARLYESTSFPSLNALLADPRIEGVVIAAPDRVHASATLECLRAGKHVLVEKPIATSVADAGTVVNAMRDTGLVVQVGAMKRHDPGVRFAARATRERIGRI
ncbi:MAG: gfo/Idh/MocA family oxidoreductase, partial [Proteobacteria bacterium]|nr:gfo/Idh/MocA family oxidoreductase [Pseudomonadota bacterium]